MPDRPGTMLVALVFAASPQQLLHLNLTLPPSATLWQALLAAGLVQSLALDLASCRASGQAAGLAMGVWGRCCDVDKVLQPGDRVELYRPLQVDPKEARRLRYRRDGLRKKAAARKP